MEYKWVILTRFNTWMFPTDVSIFGKKLQQQCVSMGQKRISFLSTDV